MLSDTYNPSEQYLGIQVLALFAKENGGHESWEDMFGVVLDVLLGESIYIIVVLHSEGCLLGRWDVRKRMAHSKCFFT